MMHRFVRVYLCFAIPLLVTLTGCAGISLPYRPSIDNIETLKRSSSPMEVGTFTVDPGMPGGTSLALRANTMTSSVGADFATYLAEAIRQELQLAGKFDPKSQIVISGALLKNNIDAGGISTNEGEIEARFVVTRNGTIQFNKIKRANTSWESSFAAAIAIPKAQQEYPLLVQKLIGSLLSDVDFLTAVK